MRDLRKETTQKERKAYNEEEESRNTLLMIQENAKKYLDKLTVESNIFHKSLSLSALFMVCPA